MQRVMLARIGRMERYQGSSGDSLLHGGSYNSQQTGSELCNFLVTNLGLLGFVNPVGRGDRKSIDLSRVAGENVRGVDSVNGVLVVFFARHDPKLDGFGGQHVVGWYRNATVWRKWNEDPTGLREGSFYNLKASAADSVLLPLAKRRGWRIPSHGKGEPGQSNVWYSREKSLARRNPPWLSKILSDIENYHGPNLLVDKDEDTVEFQQSRLQNGQGWGLDPAARKAVEDLSMLEAESHYKALKYSVENVSHFQPFDLLCKKRNEVRLVEVKGTTNQSLEEIIMTHGEVKIAKSTANEYDLFLLEGIQLDRSSGVPMASGGRKRVLPKWQPAARDLTPISFRVKVPKALH